MIDFVVVCAYFLLTLVIGIFYGKNVDSLRDFAVSHRNYSTSVMVATLFATVIGGGSTFGVSTKVFSVGILFVLAFYGAVLNKMVVAQFIAPKIGKFQKFTSIGDSMHSIYGKQGRIITGLCIIFVSIGSIGSQVAAVGFVSQYLMGIPYIYGVLIGFGVLIFYSSFGGVRSVIATDVFQFVLILVFVPIVFLIGVNKVGGISQLLNSLPQEKLLLFPNSVDFKKAFTMFVVMSFSALDPSFIQRLIIAKNIKQAIQITKITGYLSIPLFTIMGAIGLVAFVLNPNIDPNHALAYLVDNALPVGLKGLAIAGLLAALMSTADSDLHVLGLSIVQDIILPFFKTNLSEKIKLNAVRIATLIAGVFSVFVALYFKNIIDIMIFAFSFWGPTVLVPFIFALYGVVFSKKQFATGTIIGLLTVVFWNTTMESMTGFDGFIPAMILNSLYFFIKMNKFKRLAIVQK
jgi:SSS family solute:Na+ symporter